MMVPYRIKQLQGGHMHLKVEEHQQFHESKYYTDRHSQLNLYKIFVINYHIIQHILAFIIAAIRYYHLTTPR